MSAITRETFDHVMVPNYAPMPILPERGQGSRMWDREGKEYIDFAGGIAVNALGHCHPKVVAALTEQAAKLWHVSNIYTHESVLRLAQKLCQATFADRVFFANSGAEANEAALKLARKYAYDHFGPEKNEIIAFHGSFHGRTLFTVSVGGQEKYQQGFAPLPAGIKHVAYNDLAALEAAISDRTCAIMIEPIMAEGGIINADPAFVQGIRALCDRHKALMIIDEVQTGMGRTGHLYAYMGLGVMPDILTSAKALGCGFPMGAMLTKAEIAKSLNVGSHGTTCGGSPLAAAVGNAVFDLINDSALLADVHRKRQLFEQGLQRIIEKTDLFESTLRGQGLLVGCALKPAWHGKARDVIQAALQQGVMILMAGVHVIRLAPALNIPDADIHEGLERLEHAIVAWTRSF